MSGLAGMRKLLSEANPVRLMGAHDALTAVLAQKYGYDAIWAGGLGISTAAGVPDAGILTMTEMLHATALMRRAVDIPIIADVDSGFGDINVVRRMVQVYEGTGIDGVCIEDKQGPKRNSFYNGSIIADPYAFARKVSAAKSAQRTGEFLLIARIEALIVGADMDDALLRGRLYAEAGADALLIHSRSAGTEEVAEFASRIRDCGIAVPLFMIPTTYHRAKATELAQMGAAAVVYANHPIRAAVDAMSKVMGRIVRDDSTHDVEPDIASVADLFDLVKTDDLLDERSWEGSDEEMPRATP